MNKKQENKMENRKPRWQFIVIMIACLLIGGCIGFGAVLLQENLADLQAALRRDLAWAIRYLCPWGLVLCLAALLGSYFPLYGGAKKIFKSWDQEDEAVIEQAEGKLNAFLFIQSILQIVSFFLYGCCMSNLFFRIGSDMPFPLFLISNGAFLGSIFVTMITQQKVVDLVKEINPEKHGSAYALNFSKQWLSSCDEMEKQMIYKCGYRAYQVGTYTCLALWLILVLASMVIEMSLLPLLCVTVIWLTQTIAYLVCGSRAQRKVIL